MDVSQLRCAIICGCRYALYTTKIAPPAGPGDWGVRVLHTKKRFGIDKYDAFYKT